MNKDIFKDKLVQLDKDFFEVDGLIKGDYDAQAEKYDKLVSNTLYNKIMWGNSPADYTQFSKESLYNTQEGIVADIGCGSLSFTSEVYANYKKSDLFLCDFSIEMLKIAKKRIERHTNENNLLTFLRADAFNMPFKDNLLQSIMSFGILHIFENATDLVSEFYRILKPNGLLNLTSLCIDRKISAWYLNFLHKSGHVAQPRSSDEIIKIIKKSGLNIVSQKIKGGMLYLSAKK